MTTTQDVLVVDDDPDLNEAVSVVLEGAGFSVRTASHGAEALERVAERMPAAIILDVMMPVMNGWEFASEFRNRHGDAVPILVLTAAEHLGSRVRDMGVADVLGKPFDIDELVHRVHRLVDRG